GFGRIDRRSLLAQTLLLGVSGCAGVGRLRPFGAPPLRARYDMRVRLDPEQRRMDVSGVAHFPASAQARQELRFLLAPSASDVTFSCRDRHGVIPVSIADAPRAGDRQWILRFAAPVAAGAEVEVRFSYRIGGQGRLFFLGPGVCFATAWGM